MAAEEGKGLLWTEGDKEKKKRKGGKAKTRVISSRWKIVFYAKGGKSHQGKKRTRCTF